MIKLIVSCSPTKWCSLIVTFPLLHCWFTGYWNVTVYGRKHCYRLHTEHLNEAVHWVCAIQKVIDSKDPLETPTQMLIKDIKVSKCCPFLIVSDHDQ